VLLIIAIVGTTVAPWQLFFQQSNVIDKRITPRFMGYERADTTLGAFVVIVGAAAIMIVAVFAVAGTSLVGHFTDALGVANALSRHGNWYGALFSIVLLDASIIGASAVTLSTSYAFGDVFGLKHSLHRSFRDAKQFYLSYAALVAVAAAIVLIPHAPLGLITTAVQALAGVLLPSASAFLLLLCNDREVLGPWVNKPWQNALAVTIIATLLVLSGILVVTTVFPHVSASAAALWVIGVLVVGVGLAVAFLRIRQARRGPEAAGAVHPAPVPLSERSTWRMPPLALLKPVTWSPATRLGMIVLRSYLVISVLLLIVKAVQLGGG
jgi:Natural resistance-associated macrophage protein